MSIRDALQKARERRGLVKDESRVCKVCGKEAIASIRFEKHHEDGVVVLDHRTCEGCQKLAAQEFTVVMICPTDCWCEGDSKKAAAAPKVYLDECTDEEFERYADGAAKYHRSLQKQRGVT